MTESWEFLYWLVPLAFGGALIYGITGFGSALLTIPVSSHFLPMPFSLAVFGFADLVNALRVGLGNPRLAVKAEVLRIVPFTLIGTLVGITLLVNIPQRWAMFALGIFVAAFALYGLLSPPVRRTISQRWAVLAGFSGGIASTLFGAGGPPYAIYLAHRPLTKEQYRATVSMTAIFSISMRCIAFLVTGLVDMRVLISVLAVIPAGLAGVAFASVLYKRMSREALVRAIEIVLLVTGVSLIVRSFSL
jgi:uncharacterized membrane protein YfcA